MLLPSLILGIGMLAPKPNIVIILADDIGYGDLSCYGATKVKTPNLDSIARNGIRFLDGHSTATVCTPSRYSLLTGESSLRNRRAAGVINGVAPLTISTQTKTLPKLLQQVGYTTGVVGKWHLGLGETKTDYSKPISVGPNQVGFDYSFIMPATGDRTPCVYIENGKIVNDDPNDPVLVSYQQKIGTEPTGKENPELLRVKLAQGHDGTIVNGVSRIGFMTGGKKARWVDEDMADAYVNSAKGFINKNRANPFFLYLATHDVHAPLLPHKRFEGQSNCGLRGDTIRQLDWSVGEILATLKKYKLDRNTIVIFSSDNGGVAHDGYDDSRENINGHMINGILRGEKYSPYEGGHRVPFLIQWPNQVKKSQKSNALVSQIDLCRSLAVLAGAPVNPSDARDSIDLSQVLIGKEPNGRTELMYQISGAQVALRSGDWVFIPREKGKSELYNLKLDPSQLKNRIDEEVDLATTMSAKLAQLQKSTSEGS